MKNYDYEMGRLDGVKYALENAGRSGIKNEGRYSDDSDMERIMSHTARQLESIVTISGQVASQIELIGDQLDDGGGVRGSLPKMVRELHSMAERVADELAMFES